ncbi:MAG: hypothetical protein LBE34_13150 [Flavobacteriaceae bacterium]|jgi:hypothetical protein|nr:hypothetical protein [Flavobacteriaceae bacterium]
MARVDKKGIIQGGVGPVVTRNLRGRSIVQTKPRNHKKHDNTLREAKKFGKISSDAKVVRSIVQSFLEQRHDSYMYTRFTSAMSKALKKNTALKEVDRNINNADLSDLVGFEFNSNCDFSDVFLGEITVEVVDNKEIHISVPSFKTQQTIFFPEKTNVLELNFLVYEQNEHKIGNTIEPGFSYEILKESDVVTEQVFTKELHWPECFYMVVVEACFYTKYDKDKRVLYNSKHFNPSTILYVKQVIHGIDTSKEISTATKDDHFAGLIIDI